MHCLIVLTLGLVALAAAVEEWKPLIDEENHIKIHEDCVKEGGLSREQLDKMRVAEFPEEKEIQEHILCIVNKLGIFTEDGGYNADRVFAQIAAVNRVSERLRLGVAKCANLPGGNVTPAARAYSGFICMLNHKVDVHRNPEENSNKISNEVGN